MSDSTAFPVRPATVSAPSASCRVTSGVSDPPRVRVGTSVLVWSWFVVVLAALGVFKLILIAGQGENLYEAHWRVGGLRVTWLNNFAWYVFVLLGTLSLVRLGSCSRSIGVRTVRVVNAIVVVLGLGFILLTFHNGDKNYFYPILSGMLKSSSVVPYLANSLFFNPPFLAAWLFGYAAGYYVMARTGREAKVIFLTAAFGFAYAIVNLGALKVHRHELLIIDSFGLLSLFFSWQASGREGAPAIRLSVWWAMWPLAWAVFFVWALMRFDAQWHSNPATYFLGLISLVLVLFVAAHLLVRRVGNPSMWSWVLPFFVAGFFLLADSNFPSSINYSHLLCLALTFPRYIAGDIAVVGLIALSAWLYRWLRPAASLWWLNAVGLMLIVLAALDLRLCQIMGVRLGWDVFSFGDSPKMMLRMAKPYLPAAMLGLVVVGAFYGLALRVARICYARSSNQGTAPTQTGFRLPARLHHSMVPEPSRPGFARPGQLYLLATVITLGTLGYFIAESDKAEGQPALRLVRTSPLWKRVANRTMGREDFLNSAGALGLGDFRLGQPVAATRPPRDLNVLVVFMESSYNKHLSLFGSSEETQPLLSKYKDRMELFPNFFSAFTGSIHARFATFTSLYPVLDFHTFTQERVPVKSLFEVFHDRGYRCSMFYSSYFDYTGFRDFLKGRGLDEMYDADTMPGQRKTERVAWGLLEEETLGAIRTQLKQYAQTKEHFCLTYVPAAPHYPYDRIPKPFQKHKMEEVADFTPLYLNELLYIDWVISSIVDELKETGLLENTLVVITNDHGEMLGGKEGHIGHGWAVTPQLANTPLILMDPQRPGLRVNKTIGTQVDLLPTILDRLNIPVPAGELYEGQSLDAGESRAGRLGYLNSYKEFGIISDDKVLLGDRESDSPSGIASTGAVFTITNEDVKTIFVQEQKENQSTEKDPQNAPIDQASSVANTQSRSADQSPVSSALPGLQTPIEISTLADRNKFMARFESFQENLLHNYSIYRQLLRGNTLPAGSNPSPSQEPITKTPPTHLAGSTAAN